MSRREPVLRDSPRFREMYDASDPSGVPRTAKVVACYVNASEWDNHAREMFPGAEVVTIAVDARDDADVLAVEPGATTIWQVRGWLKRRISQGVYQPTVYCSRRRKHAIAVLTFRLRKDWWITDWTGHPHTLPGAAAVQYASNKYFNVSQVADPLWPRRKRPQRPAIDPVVDPPKPPHRQPKPRPPHPLEDSVHLNKGKHAATVMALPGGATGIRISASPRGSFIVDFGTAEAAHMVEVEFSKGEKDIPAPRDWKGRPARQVKIVRAATDIDADASVAAI